MQENSSFRDPSAQVTDDGKTITRMVYESYLPEYRHLMESGLYEALVEKQLLIPHKEGLSNDSVLYILPERVNFISYPYEWCFSMLKEAALVTLEVNSIALKYGMMLKDASAFNIQYHKGKMTLIDTTSFMFYEPGMPWGAYRQYCQHFLYPLLCMKALNSNVWKGNIEGITASEAVKLIPNRYRAVPAYAMHLYAQASERTSDSLKQMKIPSVALQALLNHLEKFTESLKKAPKPGWIDYANAGSYTEKADRSKTDIICTWLDSIPDGKLVDLGANLGSYSDMAVFYGHKVIAVDSDPDCVNEMINNKGFLPLVVDLCNPTPTMGWNNTERKSFLDRLHVDTILALALIHHLCIGNNVPLIKVAQMFAEHCHTLIIEFVPPDDKQAVKLKGNKNIPEYNQDLFLAVFNDYFRVKEHAQIVDSKRALFLMEKR
jgi:hypothetical protein